MTAPAVDDETGALSVSGPAWRVLLRAAGADVDVPPAADEHAAAGLAREGVLVEGQVDARVAPALRTVALSEAKLSVLAGGTRVEGWLSEEGATLAIPASGDSLAVVWVPLALLADAIARLLGLSPRAQKGARPSRMAPSELALAIASGDSQLGSILDHWLVEVSPIVPAEQPGQRIEVIDTNRGLLLLEPEAADAVELSPVSPSAVWRRLTTLWAPPVS